MKRIIQHLTIIAILLYAMTCNTSCTNGSKEKKERIAVVISTLNNP